MIFEASKNVVFVIVVVFIVREVFRLHSYGRMKSEMRLEYRDVDDQEMGKK